MEGIITDHTVDDFMLNQFIRDTDAEQAENAEQPAKPKYIETVLPATPKQYERCNFCAYPFKKDADGDVIGKDVLEHKKTCKAPDWYVFPPRYIAKAKHVMYMLLIGACPEPQGTLTVSEHNVTLDVLSTNVFEDDEEDFD